MGSVCLFVFNANVTMTHDREWERESARENCSFFHLFSIWFMQFSIHLRYFSLLKQAPSSRAIVWCDPTQRSECAKFWIFFFILHRMCLLFASHFFTWKAKKQNGDDKLRVGVNFTKISLRVSSVYAIQTRETFLRKNNIHLKEQTRWQWIFVQLKANRIAATESKMQIEKAKKKTRKKIFQNHSLVLSASSSATTWSFLCFSLSLSLRFGRRSRPSAKGQLIPHTTKISLCVRFFVRECFRRDDALCV